MKRQRSTWEWAHTIAPAAKIVVVAANGQSGGDFQSAMLYIIQHRTGYAVSNSWEISNEIYSGTSADAKSYDAILEFAASEGISFHFASGDLGPNLASSVAGSPSFPSDSPHGTAIGGTTVLNNLNGSGFVTTGWGDTFAWLEANGNIQLPPYEDNGGEAPASGSGGGESIFFGKPLWQSGLPGKGREVPDVSALADPYTGVPIVVTQNGRQQLYLGVGGTSLSTPIFTGRWAIAEQRAGEHLGQAAPILALLPGSAITDVVPQSTDTNVSGEITFDVDTNPGDLQEIYYSPAGIFEYQVAPGTQFISAVWNNSAASFYPYYLDTGFGLDGILTVKKGWDNVTGYGTPNGLNFFNAVAILAGAR